MSNILRSPNGNALRLIPRSGSTSISLAALAAWWPDAVVEEGVHPANYFGMQENWDGTNRNVAVIIRNPVERFRSMVAHESMTLEEQLADPKYGPIPSGNYARFFKFERDMELVAEWLGLPTPLPQENSSSETEKPTLTADQEDRVREIYAEDIALWESL